jgi:hypothetical protein
MSGKPRYQHDCDRCKFLGQHGKVDIYWCPTVATDPVSLSLTPVIGRFGNEGEQYAASHPPKAFPGDYIAFMQKYSNGWYLEALRLAEQAGLYDPLTRNAIPSNNG